MTRRKSKRSEAQQERGDSKSAHKSAAEVVLSSRSALTLRLIFVIAVVVIGIGYFLFRNASPRIAESGSLETNISSKVATNNASAQKGEPLATLMTALAKTEQSIAQSRLDPGQDGWETEVIAERAKLQLTRLAGRLAAHDNTNNWANELTTEVAAKVSCGRLRPDELTEVFHDGVDDKQIIVRRAASERGEAELYQRREGLMRALDELAEPFAGAINVHVHFKVVRVTSTADTAETTAYFEADGQTPKGSLQQRATWHCKWRRLPKGLLQLTSIRVYDYEEVVENGPWLVDCTEAVLNKNRSFREQLSFGLNHWLKRLGRVHGMQVFTRNGLSVGDVNGDGLDDVYLCQPGGLPNRLFVQQPDGTAIDRSRTARVDWLDRTSSALILDLDNDGDQDLVAATSAGLLVMENDGSGMYQLRATLATRDIDTQSFSAADFDNDGDLDLYICIEFASKGLLHSDPEVTFVYHNANDGAANVLFRNDIEVDGKWQFTDVTELVGLDDDNRRHSLACAWEDYDNDGDQDLYVANDYGQNCLYKNDNGTFKNVALEANVVDSASGMSVSWGDYNGDGWMDLYVANMFSSAGNRITRQQQFKPGVDPELREVYSRFAKGNTLLENDGQGRFREVSEVAGVEMGRWAWSSVFADINNDSRDDLLVANGYITTEDSGDL